jgi:hypothetical protein
LPFAWLRTLVRVALPRPLVSMVIAVTGRVVLSRRLSRRTLDYPRCRPTRTDDAAQQYGNCRDTPDDPAEN